VFRSPAPATFFHDQPREAWTLRAFFKKSLLARDYSSVFP
jgi:hypothetical protein